MRVTLPGAQKVVGPLALIAAAGGGVTVTVTGFDVPEQPAPLPTVTVKVPEPLTTIDCVCAPFDQR